MAHLNCLFVILPLAIIGASHAFQPYCVMTNARLFSSTPGTTYPSSTSTSSSSALLSTRRSFLTRIKMTEKDSTVTESSSTSTTSRTTSITDMFDSLDQLDEETRKQLERIKRSDELRAQEVFMKKSTGKHKCTNCDWEYDETKGDVMMIGGLIQPGTAFSDLPSNWRCPACRASKDSFVELVEEIPGFEVNQGYGFGTNSWTSGQKNLAVFGSLGFFFVLFLSGYALN